MTGQVYTNAEDWGTPARGWGRWTRHRHRSVTAKRLPIIMYSEIELGVNRDPVKIGVGKIVVLVELAKGGGSS